MTWKKSDGRSLRGAHVLLPDGSGMPVTRFVGLDRGPPISRPKDPKPWRSEPFKKFVRERGCVLASSSCFGTIEAHHHGKHPFGQKTDDSRCVGLCQAHHGDVTGRPFAYVDQDTRDTMTRAQVEILVAWLNRGAR